MKLVWHIVRKDFLRLRAQLGLWLLVLGAKFGLGFYIVFGLQAEPGYQPMWHAQFARWQDVTWWLMAIEGLMTFLLAARLVQGDPLTETNAFWLTRPISGGRMLAAKLGGALLLLCAPAVLAAMPWWIVCGFGARELALAAAQMFLLQAVITGLALVVGSIVDSVGRVLIWAFVGVVTIGLLSGFIVEWTRPTKNVAVTRLMVEGSLLLATCATVVGLQFFTRQRRRSLTVLASGVVGGLLVAVAWPWGWMKETPGGSEWRAENPALGAGVKLRLGSTVSVPPRPGTSQTDEVIRMRLWTEDVPAAMRLDGASGRWRWRWPSGTTVASEGWSYRLWDANDAALRRLAGLAPAAPEKNAGPMDFGLARTGPAGNAGAKDFLDTMSWLRPSLVALTRREPPTLDVQINLQLTRPFVRFETPVAANRWAASGGAGNRVVSRLEHGNVADMWIVESQSALWFDQWREARDDFGLRRQSDLLLVHRKSGQMRRVQSTDTPKVYLCGVSLFGRETSMWMEIALTPEMQGRAGTNWSAETSLVSVGYEVVSRFSQDLKFENFSFTK